MSEALEANNPAPEAEAPVAQELAPEAPEAHGEDNGFDVEKWIVEDADKAPSDEDGGPPAAEGDAPTEAELVEVERDGKKYKVPAELKDDFLRQADYTRKTQELAQLRQASTDDATREAQRQAAESVAALREDHARLAIIDRDIQALSAQMDAPLDQRGLTLRTIDWNAFRAQAAVNPQMAELYRDYRAAYDLAQDRLADLTRSKGEAETTLKTKEDQRLQTQREQSQGELVKRREETGKILAQKIEGFDQDKATKIVELAIKTYGVQPQEVAEMVDPRVWMVLHDNLSLTARAEKAEQALKQHQKAASNVLAQIATPAPKVGGAAPSARRTTDASGDELSMEEWARRDRARTAAKQAKR